MAEWRDRIIVDPDVLAGKPVIKGTRISVELLMDRLADGWSIEDIVEAYPHIKRDDVLAAIAFVTELYKEDSFIAVDKAKA